MKIKLGDLIRITGASGTWVTTISMCGGKCYLVVISDNDRGFTYGGEFKQDSYLYGNFTVEGILKAIGRTTLVEIFKDDKWVNLKRDIKTFKGRTFKD